MQWVQNPSQSNADNLNNVRREASTNCRNKRKEYLKAKIEELENDNKIKNITDLFRGISDFKRGYQPRTNRVKDEKGDLVTDFHCILARWRKYFPQLLNVHGENDVRQTEIHTAEPLVPEPSDFEIQLAIEKLKSKKSADIDQIPEELIKAGSKTISSEIHKLIIFIWNCLRSGRDRSLYLSIRWAIKEIVVIIGAYHFCQLRTKFYPTSCCQKQLHMLRKLLGIIKVDFDSISQYRSYILHS